MKSILTILYTGSVEKWNELLKDKDVDQMGHFELSSEYGIDVLVSLSVEHCIKAITKSNLKEYLQKAELYSNEKLKLACFNYVKANMAQTVMDPDIMSLASEDKDLWVELTAYCSDGITPNKRARKK